MSGRVYHLPVVETPVPYKQLARELGVSERFVRARASEGMPGEGFDYAGRRVFLVSRCKTWLDERQKRMGRTA